MKLVVIFSILIVLFSSVNGVFVFDRRLNLNNTKRMGRDFTGSERYGTFTYSGTCPTTTPGPLDGIQIKMASATTGPCFTDLSIATSTDPTIGYVCEPGVTSTIHFGYPGTDGFIIGGPSFVATGANENGYAWGSIGLPTFGTTTASCSASCIASCSASYCNPTCTAKCASSPSCVGTDNSATCTNTYSSGGTTYFAPSGFTPDNCGAGGLCCNAFSYPAPVEYRFWKLTATKLRNDASPQAWQISEFNFLKNGKRIASNSQVSEGNTGVWPDGGSPNSNEVVTKIDDDNKNTKYIAAKKSSVKFDFGSAQSFDQYQWYTGNDVPNRDMLTWTLEASIDDTTYVLIDTQNNPVVTTLRLALVGPFSTNLATSF
eukprot:TRINITY_DN211_c0_g1_i3.p1 TRINITY_DN211_c0_g1~~TRINITY_DN211_c0_g1_i3.p1  ORF type:complete len:373 (+),score=74.23 TRINITY_DN211_c0_g1_i3:29-1147(+)